MNYDYFKKRAQERSTYIGIVGILGGLGWIISPENAEIIAGSIAALMGVILGVTPDTPPAIQNKEDSDSVS